MATHLVSAQTICLQDLYSEEDVLTPMRGVSRSGQEASESSSVGGRKLSYRGTQSPATPQLGLAMTPADAESVKKAHRKVDETCSRFSGDLKSQEKRRARFACLEVEEVHLLHRTMYIAHVSFPMLAALESKPSHFIS